MANKNDLFEESFKSGNCACPYCGQYAPKIYKRKLNSSMARTLILLVVKKRFDWVHIEKFTDENKKPRCGDFSYLVHWGLVEKMIAKRQDGSTKNGFYKITGRGIMFAENKLKVQEYILVGKDSKFEGFEGEFVDVRHSLTIKFDYNELMNDVVQV